MGYVPGQSRRTACGRRVLVRVSGAHLDVPLFWQCWKLDSPIVGRITDAVRSAAAADLRRHRK